VENANILWKLSDLYNVLWQREPIAVCKYKATFNYIGKFLSHGIEKNWILRASAGSSLILNI
jgi:hypothetical protein